MPADGYEFTATLRNALEIPVYGRKIREGGWFALLLKLGESRLRGGSVIRINRSVEQ